MKLRVRLLDKLSDLSCGKRRERLPNRYKYGFLLLRGHSVIILRRAGKARTCLYGGGAPAP